jgi:hypothetical protein
VYVLPVEGAGDHDVSSGDLLQRGALCGSQPFVRRGGSARTPAPEFLGMRAALSMVASGASAVSSRARRGSWRPDCVLR